MNKPKHWIFDLDNTLHHAGHQIFPLITQRMTSYIIQHLQISETEAHRLRKLYWRQYGATLGGLVKHHNVDPAHFLAETHNMNELLPFINASNQLGRLLTKLPGRKWLFSNGPCHYVNAIVMQMKIEHVFDDIFGIEHFGPPKPHAQAYHHVMRKAGISPRHCVMVEDSLENLRMAKKLGMKTIWVSNEKCKPQWVDWRISRLSQLARLPIND